MTIHSCSTSIYSNLTVLIFFWECFLSSLYIYIQIYWYVSQHLYICSPIVTNGTHPRPSLLSLLLHRLLFFVSFRWFIFLRVPYNISFVHLILKMEIMITLTHLKLIRLFVLDLPLDLFTFVTKPAHYPNTWKKRNLTSVKLYKNIIVLYLYFYYILKLLLE